MYRWWLLNPYSTEAGAKKGGGSDNENRRWTWLPSVRIHRIMRPDNERDMHNHPWEHARTIILKAGYIEEREGGTGPTIRFAGDTATLNNDLYHRIVHVLPDGAYTMFITWRKVSSWGFKVDGKHVPWREYLGIKE